MSLKNYYWKVLLAIAKLCGLIFMSMMIIMQLTGKELITRFNMWQVILISSTVVLRGMSLINFYDLDDRYMSFNYVVNSVLADITLIVFLYWFTPGGRYFVGKGWIIIAVYIVCKSLFYLLNYIRFWQGAKEINSRLSSLGNP